MTDDDEGSETDCNTALAMDYIRALEAKDRDALLTLMTDETLFEIPFSETGLVDDGHFKMFKGFQVLGALFESIKTNFLTLRIFGIDMSVANGGQTIFVECRGEARIANGRSYVNRYIMRLDFEGRKISRIREYSNPIAMAYAFERPIGGRLKLNSLMMPMQADTLILEDR
jgi:ketosteroid isomerase-like protein